MRKHQQRQIIELIKTIKEAQEAGLYEDCRDCAIEVGEFIESVEGEGTQTVTLLEEYCDLLFKAYIGELGEKVLRRHVIKIENSIKSELKPDRMEVVFLSYKASMGDSLESIYLAAKEDPGCDAYWIPIPYFDKKTDGTFAQMHYEGAEYYGSDIECTDWQEYDIEERHPDVIFTYNPYDNVNYVTSVHPDFYCERIKRHTDCLVYVPYFVLSSDSLEETFCIVPGCKYADRVILQSEKMRDVYVRVFTEDFGYNYGNPSDKFVALGSPKFDKAINSKRGDYDIPEAWAKLIGDKKIIFYNTSIGAMLKGREQYMEKLRHVLETFKKRDDAVLWWRPHPLIETTLGTMRQKLADGYRQIVADYKSEAWGIYDDTPDPNCAIAWSDAYYGDRSSMTATYAATGKPVMLQNVNETKDAAVLTVHSMFSESGNIWMFARGINALFRVDKESMEAEYMGSFPGEADFLRGGAYLYLKPAEINGVFYFPPNHASEIAAYSVETNTFERIPFRRDVDGTETGCAFAGAAAYGKYVFFTPYIYPAIVRLDTETKELTYHADWAGGFAELFGDAQDMRFMLPCVADDKIWFTSCTANAAVAFDMETCASTIYEIGEKDSRYRNIRFDGEYFWLSTFQSSNGPIIKWSPEKGVVKEFHDSGIDWDNKGFLIVYHNDFIWMLPMKGDLAYKIDTRTDILSVAEEFGFAPPEDSERGKVDKKYTATLSLENSLYTFEQISGKLIEYDFADNERRAGEVRCSPKSRARVEELYAAAYMREPKEMNKISEYYYYEGADCKLAGYAGYIASEDGAAGTTQKKRGAEAARILSTSPDGTAGQSIYKYIKGNLP